MAPKREGNLTSNKSLELIGKHLKLFTEKIELDANVAVTEIVRKIV